MLRRRFPASAVTLIAAAFLVSNLGCATGAFRQAVAGPGAGQASSVQLPSNAPASTETAYYDGVERLPAADATEASTSDIAMAQYESPLTAAADYDNVNLDVQQVVRGQGYYNGPLKEFFTNPYVIGTAIIAGIAIPLAVENRDRPVGM